VLLIDAIMTDINRKDGARFRALDGLRGIGAIAIALYHFRYPNHLTHITLIENGYLAVDLFFILSGFVLYARYSRQIHDRLTLKRFVSLRFFRVYPLHLAMLFVFIALEFLKLMAVHYSWATLGQQLPFTGSSDYRALIPNVLLLNGMPFWGLPGWNFPSWSVSTEFIAYMLFAVVVITRIVRHKWFFPSGIILAIATYTTLAIVHTTLDSVDWGLGRCLAGFFLGMLICHLSGTARGKRLLSAPMPVIALCEITAVTAVLVTMVFASGAVIVLIVPLFVMMVGVLHLDLGPVARLLNSTVIQFLGRISYSIYMLHAFILLLLSIALKRILHVSGSYDVLSKTPVLHMSMWTGDVILICTIIMVIAGSIVTYNIIEEPARKFGRRLFTLSGAHVQLCVFGNKSDKKGSAECDT
jgi:peptidoglycan/LPS O-acetylase OafA/YrhL